MVVVRCGGGCWRTHMKIRWSGGWWWWWWCALAIEIDVRDLWLFVVVAGVGGEEQVVCIGGVCLLVVWSLQEKRNQ